MQGAMMLQDDGHWQWGRRVLIGRRLAIVNFLGRVCYVLGGLAVVRAPVTVYRALVMAPLLMVWKLGLYMRIVAGHSPKSWGRTARQAMC